MLSEIKKIARADLETCYRDEGILASAVNFDDYWARDSFFASLGLLESGGDIKKVRQVLELFIKHQRKDGKIPRKIALNYNFLKYLGIKIRRKTPRPIYNSSLAWHFSVDDNLLFVIAFCRYAEKAKDEKFARDNFSSVQSALEFYAEKKILKNDLIDEAGFANWEDTIYKKGFVLYSSVLWHEAVKDFELLRSMLRNNVSTCVSTSVGTAKYSIPNSKDILASLQRTFWLTEERYFADSIYGNRKEKYFDLAGNVLAIIFGIADKNQSEDILNLVETRSIASLKKNKKKILHPLNFPRYPFWRVSPALFLFNMADYQNGISWSWIEALLIIAQLKTGKKEAAQKTFENLAGIISKNKHIHETYFLDGRPFDHTLWKSAVPFAWGAGLTLWAIAELEKNISS